jgi:hypothetical protein
MDSLGSRFQIGSKSPVTMWNLLSVNSGTVASTRGNQVPLRRLSRRLLSQAGPEDGLTRSTSMREKAWNIGQKHARRGSPLLLLLTLLATSVSRFCNPDSLLLRFMWITEYERAV